jgi:hypothetical protein
MEQSFLEKLIVTKLINISPHRLCNPKVHYRVHKGPQISRQYVTFCNELYFFYGQELLARSPTPPEELKRTFSFTTASYTTRVGIDETGVRRVGTLM